jgi:ABC-type glycerol-3-phosphate transport system substrate-binding protein
MDRSPVMPLTRRRFVTACATGAASLLSACGGTAPRRPPQLPTPVPPQPVELQVWATEWTEATRQLWRDVLAPNFRQRFPHWRATAAWLTTGELPRLVERALAAGQAPDVVQCTAESGGALAQRGVLVPLGQRIGAWKDREELFDTGLAGSRWEGRLVGMPQLLAPRAYFFRGDILREAGVSAPPSTWAEQVNVAGRLARVQGGRLVRRGFAAPSELEVQQLVAAFGRFLERPDDLAGEEALQTLAFLRERQRAATAGGLAAPVGDTPPLAAGTVAAAYGGLTAVRAVAKYAPDRLDDLLVGEPPLPELESGTAYRRVALVGVAFLAIVQASRAHDPAWELISFLSETDPSLRWNETLYTVPPRKSVSAQGFLRERRIGEVMRLVERYGAALPLSPYRAVLRRAVERLLAVPEDRSSEV